ncbi:hypothetical protein MKW98_006533 [Papaver atlanticum]|uniref:Uncharacterized protein n=1 Tax=Papaver atlanticum TaxID=357466 RepID=A0AAD4T703_9MAGN|nr:hypothetical protein MKW98_006533 [Papaver atlanticum]
MLKFRCFIFSFYLQQNSSRGQPEFFDSFPTKVKRFRKIGNGRERTNGCRRDWSSILFERSQFLFFVKGNQSVQVKEIQNPDIVFETINCLVICLDEVGLVCCDFNEFNIMGFEVNKVHSLNGGATTERTIHFWHFEVASLLYQMMTTRRLP